MKLHKLKFEHWPWKVTYFPILVKYLAYAAIERNPFYFYAVNPGIETGGLLIESKYDILLKVPKKYRPEMQLVDLDKIHLKKFPIIIKPNHGERGRGVEKIQSTKEFADYKKHNSHAQKYIVQEYIDLPYEAGVFYYKLPDAKQGIISSVVLKEFLSVEGDGKSTIRELLQKDLRGAEQLPRLATKINMTRVPKKGELIQLEPIGNHCRGTTFLDGNHLITDQLAKVFDELSEQIEGFHYGRFDIRAESMEAVYQGKFKVLELNGAKSEPGHIYQPGYSPLKAYQSLFKHWSVMRRIARHNRKQGYKYPKFRKGLKDYKKYKEYH